MDNFVNFNNRSPQNIAIQKENEMPHEEKNLNCFDDSWSDNAADAVSRAFDNMDDFLSLYKESSKD